MLDEKTVPRLLQWDDSARVVSIYVNAAPDRRAAPGGPAMQVAGRSGLADLRSRAERDTPEIRKQLAKRLDDLSEAIEALTDPGAPGRGRALFASLDGERTEQVTIQRPLPDLAVLGDRPHVGPLVAALDEGRPAGIVAVEKGGVRVFEWAFGQLEELSSTAFDGAPDRYREMRGQPPTGAHQKAPNHRDRFERRVDDRRSRFLASVAGEVQEAAGRRHWDRLVVFGDGRHDTFEEHLHLPGVRVVHHEGHLPDGNEPDLLEAIDPVLDAAHREMEVDLVDDAQQRAAAGNRGVLGLEATLAALREGRVAHLAYDETHEELRAREASGEPAVLSEMLDLAFGTDARVTPVDGVAAEALRPDAAAAILRW